MNIHERLLAQITNPVLQPVIGAGGRAQGGTATGKIIASVMGGMFIIAFMIAFIYLITGGFHWITSGGDKTNLEHARNKIIHAVVGLIVVASVFAVVNILGKLLGLDLLNLPIPVIRG